MTWFGLRVYLRSLLLLAAIGAYCGTDGLAQTQADNPQERKTVERFLDVLLRRPRPGTSLDRVYGYHIQAGTIDDLLAELDRSDDESPGEPGGRQMLRGLLLLRRGNDAAAAEALARAESVRNDDAAASYYLAKALLRIGRNEQAAEALERAILRNPPRSEALPMFTELGRLYQRGQQNEKALEVWNRLEETFPGDARVGEQIARTLADDGRHEAALERYEKLARQVGAADETRGITFRISAAEMKLRLGRSDEALSELEAIARRLRPGSWLHDDVRRRIESVFLRGGDYSALADYYADQVQSRPDDLALRRRLGRALAKAGRINEAEESLRETVERAPEDVDVRLALVDVLKGVGKAEQAAEQLDRLTELDPENPDHLLQLGNTWFDAATVDKETRQEQAAAAWQRLAESRRDDPVVSAQVADLMRRIERIDDAMGLYRRAIELAPDEPQYREYLGEYLHRLGRHEEAVQAWMAIAEPPRDQRENLIRLAEVLHAFEEPDKGLDAFLKAAELDPTFAQRLRLSDLLARSQRYDEALAQLDLAESSADTPEELEQLLQSRISVYQRSGTLESRIAEAREAAEQSNNAESYRRLALMLDAAGRSTEAGDAIAEALRVAADDRASLAAASEIFRKAGRYGDAIQSYRSLAKLESRSLTHCLKQIAELHLQLGRIDEALVTAEELIQAQSANPDSYRFHAELCFRLGRDDEGIESLRRALRSAPRDRQSRQALAGALTERFDTDEAIEIYWGLLEDAGKLEEQEQWMSRLVPLYLRRGDFEQLINRLEQLGRDASDTRSATLLISATHRAAGDFGSARRTLEPLLAEDPRDPELLSQMVLLAEATGESEAALSYQEQLISLADTPANRSRLLKLLIDAGRVPEAEISLHPLGESGNTVEMISLIDRVIDRGDPETAIRFCHAAIERNANLWEVRVRLAGMLVMTGQFEEAIGEIERVESLGLPNNTFSEMTTATAVPALPGSSRNTSAARHAGSRLHRAFSVVELARLFGLGNYTIQAYRFRAMPPRSGSFATGTYGEARLLAQILRLAVAAKQGRLEETAESLVDWTAVDTLSDPEQLWAAYYVSLARVNFMPGSAAAPLTGPQEYGRHMHLLWRLAEIDPNEREAVLTRVLEMRRSDRQPSPSGSRPPRLPTPLTDQQVALLRNLVEPPADSSFDLNRRYIVRLVYEELTASGHREAAEAFAEAYDRLPKSPPQAMVAALAFQADLDRLEAASRTLDEIAAGLPGWTVEERAKAAVQSEGLGRLLMLPSVRAESKIKALDLLVALQAAGTTPATARNVHGTVQTFQQVNGRMEGFLIAAPHSERLLSSALVRQVYDALHGGGDRGERDQLKQHLTKDVSIFPAGTLLAQSERKHRGILTAFVRWWDGDPAAAYRKIKQLSEEHSDDPDLWIERARLAAELELPAEALAALDAIEPLDQATLQVREFAALNLAAVLGKADRVQAAAERLLRMRLDAATERALVDRLTRLGMLSMSAAILEQSHRRGGKSAAELVKTAEQMLQAGERGRAAEVAYEALRQSDNDRSGEPYRRAVSLLQSAGGLDRVLETAERHAAAAPRSVAMQLRLADLYHAAGRRQDAERVHRRIVEMNNSDPQTLWEAANRLAEAGKHGEAIELFLKAAETNAAVLNQRFDGFERSITATRQYAKAFDSLAGTEIERVGPYAIDRLIALADRAGNDSADAVSAFLERVFRTSSIDIAARALSSVQRNESVRQSDAVAGAVRQIFENESVYLPVRNFWRAQSLSSGGNMTGALGACVEIIRARADVNQDVREQLAARRQSESTEGIARLLELAVDIDSLNSEQLEEKTRELLERQHEIPYDLWWQFGQLLEYDHDRRHVAVIVFEYAQRLPNPRPTGTFNFSPDAKLIGLYFATGQKNKARVALRRAYGFAVRSDSDQFAPPVTLDRELQSISAIAEKLEFADGRLDAVCILADVLANPRRLNQAPPSPSGSVTPERIRRRLKDTVGRLQPSDFERPLTLPWAGTKVTDRDKGSVDDEAFPLDASALVPITSMPAEHSSPAVIVITELAKSQDGRDRLHRLRSELDEALKQHSADRVLLAIRVLSAVALSEETAAEYLLRMIDTLPETASQIQEPTDDEREPVADTDHLFALFSPALLALESPNEDVRRQGDRLAKRLIALARSSRRDDLVTALSQARAAGRNATADLVVEAMRTKLDIAAPAGEVPLAVSKAVAEQCLQIAEAAAEAGAWEVALESLHRGFGGGPPRTDRGLPAPVSQAFRAPPLSRLVDNRIVPSVNPRRAAEEFDWVAPRISAVVEQVNACGEAEARTVYLTLKDIVFPPLRSSEVFPYPARLVKLSLPSSDPPNLRPPSVARMLAEAAVAAAKDQELAEMLDRLGGNSETPELIALIRVYLAAAQGDKQAASEALDELMHAIVEKPLPAVITSSSGAAVNLPGRGRLTEDPLRADIVMHAVFPVIERWGRLPQVSRLEIDMLRVAARSNDFYFSGSWGWTIRSLIAAGEVDDAVLQPTVDAYLANVRRLSSRSRGEMRGAALRDSEEIGLIELLLQTRRWEIATTRLRGLIERNPGFQNRLDTVGRAGRQLIGVDAEVRYRLLSHAMLGEGDDQPLLTTSSAVLAVEPPAVFAPVFADRERAGDIPVGGKNFPVVDLSLLAAEAAAACDRTEEWVQRLQPHVAEPGDDVDAMIGLALLAAGRIEAAGEVLSRVVKHLQETAPSQEVDSPMPIASAIFAARCGEAEQLRQEAASAWKPLLIHSRRRPPDSSPPFFSRSAALAEWGDAADVWPLKHFVPIQIPLRDTPAVAAAVPTAFVDDGVLHAAGGAELNVLMLKYPLAGDFTFSHRSAGGEAAESHMHFGGIAYMANLSRQAISVRGLGDRNTIEHRSKVIEPGGNLFAVQAAGDLVTLVVNGSGTLTDRRTEPMPFVGLVFEAYAIPEMSDIKLTGSPAIPRQVNLIEADLRGWDCAAGGPLVPINLPTASYAERDRLESIRRYYGDPERLAWYVGDGALYSKPADLRHIQYQRPLLDGESLSYEFFFDADSQEVHPTIGRVAVLLRPDGARLRWLPQGMSAESLDLDPLNEVEPDEVAGEGIPQLKADAWNQVTLTAEGDRVVVEVNGEAVCRAPTSLDRRFGLFAEPSRSSRVRAIRLTGPWPATLPENLMERP